MDRDLGRPILGSQRFLNAIGEGMRPIHWRRARHRDRQLGEENTRCGVSRTNSAYLDDAWDVRDDAS